MASYPAFIQRHGFERSLEEKSDETLLNILDSALKSCGYDVSMDIQKLILFFTPFSTVTDAVDIIISLESYPMQTPNLERVDDIVSAMRDKVVRKRVADIADKLVQHSLDNKIQTMHPFWYYVASFTYRLSYGKKLNQRSNELFILIRQLLLYGRPLSSESDFIKDSDDTLPRQYGKFTSAKHKQFCSALLAYWNQSKVKNLKKIAEDALDVLAVDYNKLYDVLVKNNSPVLKMQIPQQLLCQDKSIKSQREVMGSQMLNDILKWLNANADVRPKGYVLSDAEVEVKKFFEDVGLDWNRVVKVARKSATNLLRKSEVMMMFYRLIGESVNDDFQDEMYKLYVKNRTEILKLEMPSYDPFCKLVSPPIKTISRARFKIKEDYMKDEKPVEGSVLDWVRCAIVVESDVEMKSFFDLLCDTYKGSLIRMKNKFDPKYEVHGGYRAVMVNLIWTNKNNPQLSMIIEIQLILASYLPIRSKTHLFYKIFRAKSWRAMADDFAKFSDV
eukprot:415982_1